MHCFGTINFWVRSQRALIGKRQETIFLSFRSKKQTTKWTKSNEEYNQVKIIKVKILNSGSFPVSHPLGKFKTKLFENCSHGVLHVRSVVKTCSR